MSMSVADATRNYLYIAKMMTFTDALIISAESHRDMWDSGGVEYIKHPLHLAHLLKVRGYSNECQMTALLHDVVEDTKTTIEDLIAKGAPESVIIAIKLLTHIRDEAYVSEMTTKFIETGLNPRFAKMRAKEEEYFRYVRNIGKNDIARAVKLMDLEHNSDISRIPQKDMDNWDTREYIGRRNMKYAIARNILTGGRVGY